MFIFKIVLLNKGKINTYLLTYLLLLLRLLQRLLLLLQAAPRHSSVNIKK